MINRTIIMVLDGFGVGEAPDANIYGDEGSNTLVNIYNAEHPNLPNMKKWDYITLMVLKLQIKPKKQ